MANPMEALKGKELPPPTENRGTMLLQATWIMAAIAIPVVVARVCARIKHLGKLSWDDCLMILSLLCALVSAGLTTHAVDSGLGRHIFYLTPEQITEATKAAYAVAPFAYLALVLGRVSFAVSLIILIGTKKWRRWLLYLVIASQFVVNIFLMGTIMFACSPIRKFWDPKVPGHCLRGQWRRVPGYLQGAFNIFADLVLAIMPSVVIANLNLKRRIKVGLIVLMVLGVFNMIAAVVTVVELVRAPGVIDVTYEMVIANIWGIIQMYLVIVIASIPFLRPLFTGTKAFSWEYYRSLIVKYSHRSRSLTEEDRISQGSEETLYDRKGKPLKSLPHIPKDRFVTTTLKNAGMQTTVFDKLAAMEEGEIELKR